MINSFDSSEHRHHNNRLLIIGGIIAIAVLALLATFYGRFLKTTVNTQTGTYTLDGSIKTDTLPPDTYTLEFAGQSANGNVTTTTSFTLTEQQTTTQSPTQAQTTTEPQQAPQSTTSAEPAVEPQSTTPVQPAGEPTAAPTAEVVPSAEPIQQSSENTGTTESAPAI